MRMVGRLVRLCSTETMARTPASEISQSVTDAGMDHASFLDRCSPFDVWTSFTGGFSGREMACNRDLSPCLPPKPQKTTYPLSPTLLLPPNPRDCTGSSGGGGGRLPPPRRWADDGIAQEKNSFAPKEKLDLTQAHPETGKRWWAVDPHTGGRKSCRRVIAAQVLSWPFLVRSSSQ